MGFSLSQSQQKAVQHQNGPLLVLAGPGAGKTRVIIERIRRLLTEGKEHYRILALTFTRRAADELTERLSDLGEAADRVYAGTFHGFCREIITARGQSLGVSGKLHVIGSFEDRSQILLDQIISDPELESFITDPRDQKGTRNQIRTWLEFISEAKQKFISPEMIEDSRKKKIYESYNAGLRASLSYDYDDLIFMAYRLLTERPRVADFYRKQYKYIIVDESQDLNDTQYGLLRALSGGVHKNIMMVGDPQQSIFRFNGSDPAIMSRFAADFRATEVRLEDNFRSSRSVVHLARKLMPDYQAVGSLPVLGEVTVVSAEDEEDEARRVVSRFIELSKNGHPDVEGRIGFGRMAILGRNRYCLLTVEQELILRNVPYTRNVGGAIGSESSVFKAFDACLSLIANPMNRIALQKIVSAWGGTRFTLEKFDAVDAVGLFKELSSLAQTDESRAVLEAVSILLSPNRRLPVGQALDRLCLYSDSVQNISEREIILRDLEEWRRSWSAFAKQSAGNEMQVGDFVAHLTSGHSPKSDNGKVHLLTIHSAKGLEFDVVAVIGMCEGILPDYRAQGESLKEEERSAFVAITRSRRILMLSYPKVRLMPWGENKAQKPSRFLEKLGLSGWKLRPIES